MFDSTSTTSFFFMFNFALSQVLSIFTKVSIASSVTVSQPYGYCNSNKDCNDNERCFNIPEYYYPLELLVYKVNGTCKVDWDCVCLSDLFPPRSKGKGCNSPNVCNLYETCFIPEGPYMYANCTFSQEGCLLTIGWCTSCKNTKHLFPISPLVELNKCLYSNNAEMESTESHRNPSSTCTASLDCEVDEMCMALTDSGVFSACSRRLFAPSFVTPCFCMNIQREISFQPKNCTINNDNIQFRETMFTCMPCSFIANLSSNVPRTSCQNKFPEPSLPREGKKILVSRKMFHYAAMQEITSLCNSIFQRKF